MGNPETEPVEADPLLVGARLRHLRRRRGRTLADVAGQVGISPSALSLIETGKREARHTVLTGLAAALDVGMAELFESRPPSRRAALEVELERVQRARSFETLHVPAVRPGPRVPTEALEALVLLHRALAAAQAARDATPEYARRANAALRGRMRDQDNYFAEIEQTAAELLAATGYAGGPVTRTVVDRMASHLGFTLVHTSQLPESTRTVTDLAHRRIYLPQPGEGQHDSRWLALHALGHVLLDHDVPADYGEFLAQRVEANYLAAALLIPEQAAVPSLRAAKSQRDLAIEDLRDAYAVSYETAAHRFTNLATRHLDLRVHFMRISAAGVIFKAYENDGVRFPADSTGAIEGQRVCRSWTARKVFEQPDRSAPYQQYTDTGRGTFWCTSQVEQTPVGPFSVSVGVGYADVRWMRGRATRHRATSRCPDPTCCQLPAPAAATRWSGRVWPDARVHSHLLAAMPPGVFPGVDDVEVVEFLEQQNPLLPVAGGGGLPASGRP